MKTTFAVFAQIVLLASVASSQNILKLDGLTVGVPEGASGATFFASSVFGGLPDDPLGLLQQKQIQEELELTNAQVTFVEGLKEDVERQTRELFQAQAKFGGDAARLMATATKAVRENITKEVENLLEPNQLKRLGQIEVQMKIKNRGVLALVEEGRISEALEIGDEQKKEIKGKQRDAQRELTKKIEELRLQYRNDLIKEVLSEKQLLGLEELSGDDYKVEAPNIRRLNIQ